MKANNRLKCFLNISKFISLLNILKFITVKSATRKKIISKKLNFKELNLEMIYIKQRNPHKGWMSEPRG